MKHHRSNTIMVKRINYWYNIGSLEDHNPPHFHAEYNGNKAIVDIIEARVIKGLYHPGS